MNNFSKFVLLLLFISNVTIAQNFSKFNFHKLPKGTIINDDNESFILPNGYEFVGRDSLSKLVRTDEIRISCFCAAGDGDCSPFVIHKKYGCFTSDCTRCVLIISGGGVEIFNGGIVHLTGGIERVISKDPQLPNAFEAMFELNEVIQAINDLNNLIYPGGLPNFIINNDPIPQGFEYRVINLFGNLAAYPVPSDYFDDVLFRIAGFSAKSCDCQKGVGTCVLKRIPVAYCKNTGCTVCTLIISSILKMKGITRLEIRPNPVKNKKVRFKFLSDVAQNVLAEVLDIDLNQTIQKQINCNEGINNETVQLPNVFSGHCIFTLITNTETLSQSFIVE